MARKPRSLLYYVLPDVYPLIVRCEHIYRQVTRLFARSPAGKHTGHRVLPLIDPGDDFYCDAPPRLIERRITISPERVAAFHACFPTVEYHELVSIIFLRHSSPSSRRR